MGGIAIVAAIILVPLLLIAVWVIGVYNMLQRQRIGAQTAFANIDALLKRRCDLIPNLVEAVKGYAKHESGTLESVMRARASAMGARDPAERMKAEGELSGVLSRLMAVAEAYPDLQANQNFLQLQGELGTTEDGIARARTGYNSTIAAFNETLSVFPSNLIAGLFGFQPMPFFETSEGDRAAPKVQF